jgi:hypothetical protein
MRSCSPRSYLRIAAGLYLPPERVGIDASRAPARNASAASRTVRLLGARSFPRFTAASASARHAFAAASVGNVLWTLRSSRLR